jgi:arylsulfatase
METFAGFAEHTDEQVGRLVSALKEMGELDKTLFIYIVGDNGASAEGGPEGAYNEMMALNGIVNTAEINMPHLEEWGGPSTFRTTRSAGHGPATRRSSGPSRSRRTTAARRMAS